MIGKICVLLGSTILLAICGASAAAEATPAKSPVESDSDSNLPLNRRASLYILDEPTVGIDVGAKVKIYRLIEELTEQGAGILILSADLLELLGTCDRVLVMFRGNVVGESSPEQTNSNELLRWATGAGEVSPTGSV